MIWFLLVHRRSGLRDSGASWHSMRGDKTRMRRRMQEGRAFSQKRSARAPSWSAPRKPAKTQLLKIANLEPHSMTIDRLLDIGADAAAAIEARRPIVALESTIITH